MSEQPTGDDRPGDRGAATDVVEPSTSGEAEAGGAEVAARRGDRGPGRFGTLVRDPARLWHYFGIPAIVVIALVLTLLYVTGEDLSSREARSLNADVLTEWALIHLRLSLITVFFVLAIALPVGIMLTRPWARRFTPVAVAVANAGQAIPSFGLLVLLAILIGIGSTSAVIATVAYCILPVLRNTMVGLDQVDRDVIEAARGMGMTKRSVLWRIEMPLAVPVMLAGVRTSLILAVGTLTLGALIGADTLGRVINRGIVGFSDPVLITGAVMTAAFALVIDWLAGIVEDLLRPRGL